jgi:hypothetical protein
MVDKDGNESTLNVLSIILTRAGVQIRDDLEQLVTSNYNLVFQMAEEFYIHPAIKSKLTLFKL